MTFCTFGVVQSFGVYQDYYTVSVCETSVLVNVNVEFSVFLSVNIHPQKSAG